MSVKGYLALLAITVVERNLAGDLGGAVDGITQRHYPKARAARDLRAVNLTERRALANFLLSGEPADAERVQQARRDFERIRGQLTGIGLDQRELAVLAEIDGLQRDHRAATDRAVALRRAGRPRSDRPTSSRSSRPASGWTSGSSSWPTRQALRSRRTRPRPSGRWPAPDG
jgi:hypothetical protein